MFTKVPASATERSSSAGLFFLLVCLLTGFLVFDEISQFFDRDGWSSSLTVDTRPIPEQHHMSVDLDITFPSMQCGVFGFDVMDVTGELQLGAENKFLRETVGNGCRMYGSFEMHRVNGEFHFAFGRMSQEYRDAQSFLSATQRQAVGHVHLFMPNELKSFNASHTVNHLEFANKIEVSKLLRLGMHGLLRNKPFKATNNPYVDSMKHMYSTSPQGRTVYLLKVIPVELHYSNGDVEQKYEYTVNTQHIPIEIGPRFYQPGVFFRYELSPYTVIRKQLAPPFSHTLVSCLSIIAGMLMLSNVFSTYISNIIAFVTCGRVTIPKDAVPPIGGSFAPAVMPSFNVPIPGFNPELQQQQQLLQQQQQLLEQQQQQQQQVEQQQPMAYMPYTTADTTKNRHLD